MNVLISRLPVDRGKQTTYVDEIAKEFDQADQAFVQSGDRVAKVFAQNDDRDAKVFAQSDDRVAKVFGQLKYKAC